MIFSVTLVLILSKVYGEEVGLIGVIVATIITNLTICHVVEPYILYKHAFHLSPKKHIIKNYCYMGIFVLALGAESLCMQTIGNDVTELFINGGISIIFSLFIGVAILIFDGNFRSYLRNLLIKKKLTEKFDDIRVRGDK